MASVQLTWAVAFWMILYSALMFSAVLGAHIKMPLRMLWEVCGEDCLSFSLLLGIIVGVPAVIVYFMLG